MPRDSVVRARHMKSLLASVDRLAPERSAAIRASLGADTLRSIDDASGVEWLPLQPNLALSHALHLALGPQPFADFHRRHFVEAFRGPLFRPLVDGASAVFGLDTGSWMRLVPTAWRVLFRNCGDWTIAAGDRGRVDMVLSDLPAPCLVDRVWPLSVAASLSATLDVTNADGEVELVGADAVARAARFALSWAQRERAPRRP